MRRESEKKEKKYGLAGAKRLLLKEKRVGAKRPRRVSAVPCFLCRLALRESVMMTHVRAREQRRG